MTRYKCNAHPEAYLDWKLLVEKKFYSHLVPERRRVRLATIDFTNFALFWWDDICAPYNDNHVYTLPQTWNALK